MSRRGVGPSGVAPSSGGGSRQVTLVQVGRDVVGIDQCAGEYFLVPLSRVNEIDLRSMGDAFGATGVTASSLGRPMIRLDLVGAPRLGVSRRERQAFMIESIASYVRFPFLSFRDLLREAEERGVGLSRDPSRVTAVCLMARRLLPLAPRHGACLYRSYLLLRTLRRLGLDADWAFGVKTWPFEAHCWLELGPLVLDDRSDRVGAFTPLLRI